MPTDGSREIEYIEELHKLTGMRLCLMNARSACNADENTVITVLEYFSACVYFQLKSEIVFYPFCKGCPCFIYLEEQLESYCYMIRVGVWNRDVNVLFRAIPTPSIP